MSYKRNNYKKYFFDRHSFKFIITRYWEDRCNKAKAMWKIILDDTTQDGMLIECFLETKKERRKMENFFEKKKRWKMENFFGKKTDRKKTNSKTKS